MALPGASSSLQAPPQQRVLSWRAIGGEVELMNPRGPGGLRQEQQSTVVSCVVRLDVQTAMSRPGCGEPGDSPRQLSVRYEDPATAIPHVELTACADRYGQRTPTDRL